MKAAIEAMVETGVKAAVKAKAEWTIEEARTPEAVVIGIRIPKPAISGGVVTRVVLRDQFILVGFGTAAGGAPDV